MLELDGLAEVLRVRLEAKHEARERALRESRHAIRCSANAIRATHRDDREDALALLNEADVALRAARAACAHQPEVEFAGFIVDAQKEYAEARTTFAIVTGQPLPGPEDLDMRDAAWLNGLAETVGELRRHLLDVLRSGRLERCERLLEAMDDIYALLVTIDFPEGITGGLRRPTDIARSIIERTRGDLTNALVQARLRDALDAHRADLLGG
ncbi:MAG: haloacid dehalogenase [Egibacteraceae bacterium]